MFGRQSRPDAREGITLIGEEARFHGSLVAKGSLRVEGTFEGDITDAAAVEVGARGRLVGNVAAESVVVAGELRGNVVASHSVELQATARLVGDVRTPRLRIDEGAFFEGSCAMEADADKSRRGRRRHEGEPAPAEAEPA